MTECTLQANRPVDVVLPDLTDRNMVPHKLTFVNVIGPQDSTTEEPGRGITCRISSNTELMNLGEPYFQHNNTVSFADCWYQVRANGRIRFTVTSKTKEVRRFRIYSEYKHTYGGVIYEEKVDKFDTVLQQIHERGRCTRINITCPKPLKSLDFVTTACCVEGEWIESFGATVESDPATVYSFDFTQGDLKEYADQFKYLQLQVAAQGNDNDFYIYVTAYGFPYSK